MVLLVVFFVPRPQFPELFWFGLLWGFLGTIAFESIFGKVLGLFNWQHIAPFEFLGQSLWVCLAWIFSIIFYLSNLPETRGWFYYLVYLLAFSIASAALDKVFYQVGLLNYLHWNPFYRFLVALVWFHGAYLHYKFSGLKKGSRH